uniref:Cysteine dioxygenase n=1 Tax=viral metagenome TaxID=1070528 RepID=A0A6C0J053_9ZZZZ
MISDLIKDIDKHFKQFSDMKSLKNIDCNLDELKKFVFFDKEKYKKNVVYRNSNYEIILITWLPGQQTKLHAHPKNGCIMKVLEGELNENLYIPGKIIDNIYKKEDISYIDNTIGKHIISNNSKNNTISLHIYSPPNYYK